jgi:hypothetical protein
LSGQKSRERLLSKFWFVRQTFAGDYVRLQIPRRQSQIDRHLLELEPPQTSLLQPYLDGQDPILIFSSQILCESWTKAKSKSSSPTILKIPHLNNIPQYVAINVRLHISKPDVNQVHLVPNSAFCASSPERYCNIGQRLDQVSKFARIPFALEQYLEKQFRHCWQYKVPAAFLRHDVDRNNDPAVKRTLIHARPQ